MTISDRIANGLASTRTKCLELRNRVYPVSQWPGELFRRAVSDLGGPQKTLLEVGCGRDATDLQAMKDAYGRLIGIDFEIKSALPSARCTALVGDAHNIPLAPATVDCICMADVVEHLSHPVAAFQECARVLKPGGHLVIRTVNLKFPPIFLAQALPHAIRQRLNHLLSGTPPDDVFPAYYRANTAKSLRNAAQQAGFETCRLAHVSHHPRYLMFSYPVYRAGVMVEQIVRRHEALKGVRHFILAVFRRP